MNKRINWLFELDSTDSRNVSFFGRLCIEIIMEGLDHAKIGGEMHNKTT